MNTPNPLVPQGSLLDKGKSHFRITVFATLAVHVVLLCVLLIAGCNKKTETGTETGIAPAPSEAWPTSSIAAPAPLPPPPPLPATPTQETAVLPLTQSPPIPGTPIPPGPVPEVAMGAGSEHTIVKGETFATIGKKYGVGYKAIEAANPNINPTRLKIGDKIKIPPAKSPSATTGSASALGNGTGADGSKTYKVKSGDNLGKISKTYGVSTKQLRAANNLKTDQIKVGQVLKIPAATSPSTPAAADATAPPPVPAPGPQ